MSIQLSTALRNAILDQIETTIGAGAILKIRTGAQPTNVAAADSGTVLATLALPGDWMAAATGGSKGIAGSPWQDTAADAGGTAAHFRIYASDGTTCHMQGTVGQGSGDLSLDNIVLAAGQLVQVTGFSLTAGNA